MMSLQVVSQDKELLNDVAGFLLKENLIVNAIISHEHVSNTLDGDQVVSRPIFLLKGISKSLLFGLINNMMCEKYGDRMPLVYSEPIILIDPKHTEAFMEQLRKI
ncbi:MAG: hypothetical protein Aureis2KO_32630 [Aureisphaera sp.]